MSSGGRAADFLPRDVIYSAHHLSMHVIDWLLGSDPAITRGQRMFERLLSSYFPPAV